MGKINKLLTIISVSFLMSSCNINEIPNFDDTNSGEISESGEETPEIINVSSISFAKSFISLGINDTYQLVPIISPADATNKSVNYSSQNNEIATVSETGLVTAKKIGETSIRVTTEDGNKSASIAVIVSGIEENDNNDVIEINPPEDDNKEEFSITADDMNSIDRKENVITLSPSINTVYSLSGKYEGQIVVDALNDAKVELDLNNVSLSCSLNSPIFIKNSGDVEIKSQKGTINYIYDNRPLYVNDDEEQGKGAIYSLSGDISFTGKGTLIVNAGYYNGVHTKDDFSLKNTNLKITAPHHAVKANDGIKIESGAIDIDAGGDGLVTENTGLSSKGNQKGNIDIIGGSVLINSVGDGINAAYNANISGDTAIEIKTDKFSSYNGSSVGGSDNNTQKSWYLRIPSQYYSTSYKYAAYINDSWVSLKYKESQRSGRTTYYIYDSFRSEEANSFKLYRFTSSQEYSLDTYNAVSDTKSFSDYGNMVTISSISSSKISLGSWGNYQPMSQGGPGGGMGQEGNNDKADHSAKGIKSYNEIHIDGGTISITAYDDGLHTNCDDVIFDNELTPTGNLYITGGDIKISASDDGIHSDTNLYISGGKILVNDSYEGIEGNVIDISGGDITVFAKDDGINASSGKLTPQIIISGGRVDETVSPNGDTDGIDSNGSYTQSGGIVIARGPNSSVAAALDTDGNVTLSGGTLILLGSIEKTPRLTNMTTTTSLSGHSSGDHTIIVGSEEISYNNKYTYAKTTVYSEFGSARIK